MKYYSLKGYDIQRLFNYIILMDRALGKQSDIRIIISILKKIMCREYWPYLVKRETSNIILFMSFINKKKVRTDIVKMFDDVMSTVPNLQYDILKISALRKFSIRKILYSVFFIVNIQKQLKGKYTFHERILAIQCSLDYLDLFLGYDEIKDFNYYKLFVVYYDAPPLFNFTSQYLRLKGVKTATVQHGIMLAPRGVDKINLDYCGIEFNSFVSDFFLAWNDFTRKEALNSGLSEEKIIIVGCAKCIYADKIQPKNGSRTVGLILDGIMEKENNSDLLDIIKKFCEKMDYKCVVRFHPSYPLSEKKKLTLDKKYAIECPPSNLSEFLAQCEFCVVSNSTCLFELEAIGFPFLHYSSRNEKDKYKDYPLLSFGNTKEMIDLYKEGIPRSNGESNIYKNYQHFFSCVINSNSTL